MIDLNHNNNSKTNIVDTTKTSDNNYKKTGSDSSFISFQDNIEHLNDDVKSSLISGDTLTFATHNVQGLRDSLKGKQILETFNLQNIDFIGLTETHHNKQQKLQYLYQKEYLTFWSNNNNNFSGTSLLIRDRWAKYIHKVYDSNE